MKRFRLLPGLAPMLFVAASFVAAICVTDVRRLGDNGPWVGEFTNYRSETIGLAYVESSVVDADGRDVTFIQAGACPSTVAPGESAAFELAVDPGALDPRYVSPLPRPPFRLGDGPRVDAFVIPAKELQYAFTRMGLSAEVVRREPSQKFLVAELHNSSIFTMQDAKICAVVRSPSGAVLAVGNGRVAPSRLAPATGDVVPVFFPTGMPAGRLEVFVEARPTTGSECCWVDVPTDNALTVSVARVVNVAGGRFLYVVGELRNTTDRALSGYSLTAHLDDSWTERVDGAGLGCDGRLGRGDTVPYSLLVPVTGTNVDRTITIEGIEANLGETYYRPVVSDMRLRTATKKPNFIVETREVSFTLKNDSASWIWLQPACIGLRDVNGKVVGANFMTPGDYLAPGGSVSVKVDVEQLAGSTSAEVVAYAVPLLAPPQR
jgi:hypothetical protein